MKLKVTTGIMVIIVLLTCAVSSEPVKLTYWIYFADNNRAFVEETIIERFNATHSDIQVEILNLGGKKAADILTKIASGIQIDIITINRSLSSLLYMDYTVNLSPYIQRDNFNLGIYRPGTTAVVTYGGQMRALPFMTGSMNTYINQDLFAEAGLKEPQRGWTFNDLDEYLKKLNRVSADGVVTQWALGTGTSPDAGITPLILADGGGYFIDGKFALHKDPVPQRADWLFNNIQQNLISTSTTLWETGVQAMKLDWEGRVTQHLQDKIDEKFTYKLGYLPTGAAGEQGYSFSNAIAIMKSCKNPDAAWEFLKYFAMEGDIFFGENLLYPVTIPGAQAMVRKGEQILPRGYNLQTFFEPVLNPPSRWIMSPEYVPGFASVRSQVLDAAVRAMIKGEKSARVAYSEIADAVDAIVSEEMKGALKPSIGF